MTNKLEQHNNNSSKTKKKNIGMKLSRIVQDIVFKGLFSSYLELYSME